MNRHQQLHPILFFSFSFFSHHPATTSAIILKIIVKNNTSQFLFLALNQSCGFFSDYFLLLLYSFTFNCVCVCVLLMLHALLDELVFIVFGVLFLLTWIVLLFFPGLTCFGISLLSPIYRISFFKYTMYEFVSLVGNCNDRRVLHVARRINLNHNHALEQRRDWQKLSTKIV